MVCAKGPILIQPIDGGVNFVEDLFEPQLVCLMNNNEKQFVVARWFGQGFLQFQQFVNFQILIV